MDAAIYCRISHVNDASTIGVDRQEADGRGLVERRGWRLAALHIDNNRSAWKRGRKRPGWDALLDDIRERRVDVVVVAHPDRLIRQPRDLEDLLDLARDTGVQLVSAGGDRDLSNPDDVFILRIEVAHACRSSDDTSRRVRRGHEAAAAAGRPGGGTGRRRPYGYETDQLTVRPSERLVVQEAARRILSGETLASVCRDLDERHVPTISGVTWKITVLAGILRSPRTAGLREHRRQIVGPAVWPALLEREQWEAVRCLLNRPVPAGQNRRRHLLSGLAVCGVCELGMIGRSGTPPGYACPRCCQRVARHLLDDYVVGEVLRRVSTANLLAAILPPQDEQEARDRALVEACEARVARVLAEWEATGASAAWARERVDAINAEKQLAERRLAGGVRRSALAGLVQVDRAGWDVLPLGVRRAIVAELMPDLTVYRTLRRGRGFDPTRVTFSRPEPACGSGAVAAAG